MSLSFAAVVMLILKDLAGVTTSVEAQLMRGGRQYIIFFMENPAESPLYLPLEIYIIPLTATKCNVKIESPKWSEPLVKEAAEVGMGAVKRFNIPYPLRQTGSGLSTKALYITSDQEIIVYGVNRERYSTDSFLALPVDVLGTAYYAVTHWPNSDSSLCQIGIAAVFDGTLVHISLPKQSGRGVITINYNGQVYTNEDTLSIVLNRFSTLQLQSTGDLTGTFIQATQKVAVFSGNIQTSVGSGTSRDHLVVMVPPVSSWGRTYSTVPIPGSTVGDFFYILACENGTRVDIESMMQFSLNAAQSRGLLISSSESVAIHSTKPILVVQLSQSQQGAGESGDPTLVLLPAQEQWMSSYRFSTLLSTTGDKAYKHYLMLSIPTGKEGRILLDGEYLNESEAVWHSTSTGNYSARSFVISEGSHMIAHEDQSVTFSAVVYGRAEKESYGYAADIQLPAVTTACERTESVPGDGIDNDCDEAIDEDNCEVVTNSDCALLFSSSANFTKAKSAPDLLIQMIAGPPGAQGPPGPPGLPGQQGVPGYNGSPGDPGSVGVQGATGSAGEKGVAGVTGPIGATGTAGPAGETGRSGSVGPPGPLGERGLPGMTGSKGEPGVSLSGDKGERGIVGSQGQTGMTGYTGALGAPGQSGEPGQPGYAGQKGEKGETGIQGDTGLSYQDIDECTTENSNMCSYGCENTVGSFRCFCRPGFVLDATGAKCIDKDECAENNNGGCVDACHNLEGSFLCSCTASGYKLANDSRSCQDIDECKNGSQRCTEQELCINSIGSYVCVKKLDSPPALCSKGLQRTSDGNCSDVDECETNNGGCSDRCHNMAGSYYCSCGTDGFKLSANERTCVDKDECVLHANSCDATELCINNIGSFYCSSNPAVSRIRVTETKPFSGLVDGQLILTILVWIAVLSLLILLLLIMVCLHARRHQDIQTSYMADMDDIYQILQEEKTTPDHTFGSDMRELSSVTLPSSLSYS